MTLWCLQGMLRHIVMFNDNKFSVKVIPYDIDCLPNGII